MTFLYLPKVCDDGARMTILYALYISASIFSFFFNFKNLDIMAKVLFNDLYNIGTLSFTVGRLQFI